MMKPPSEIFQALHYSCAFAAILFVLATSIANLGAVESQPRRKALAASRPSQTLLGVLVLSYVAEYAVAIAQRDASQSEAQTFHSVVLILVWAFAWARRASVSKLPWGIAGVTLPFEVASLIATSLLGLQHLYPALSFSSQITRVAILLFIPANHIRIRYKRLSPHKDLEETRPLVSDDNDRESPNGYGAAISNLPPEGGEQDESGGSDTCDSDSEDDTASIRRRRAKRLRETGGWWGYLKDFSIFLPYLLPKKDRKVQLCLVISLVCIAANRVLRLLIPRQLGIVTDELLNHREVPLKDLAIWLLLSVLSDDGALSLIKGLAKIPIQQFSYRQITNAAFNHVLSLSMEFHSDRDSAEVMKAIEQGEALTNLLETVVTEILPTFVDLALAFVFLYWKFNSTVALAVAVAAVSYISLDVAASRWNIKNRRESSQAEREEARVMHQAVQGWQTVTYFNMFGFEKRRFGQAVDKKLAAGRNWANRDTYTETALSLMIPCTFFIIAGLVLQEIAQRRASPGDFVFLIQYWEYLIWPLQFLSHNYRYMMSDLVDAERLLHLLQTKPTIVDRDDAKDLENVKGLVAFDHVQFSYDPRVQTFPDLSFSVSPGQTVALVGETGAGKSSIIKLLLRFYDINGGSITIDGHDIRDITLSSLRNALGVVPQDPLLFNASILENLRYARPSATDSEIYDACRAAAIHDKVLSFADGYETKVGEQGVKLSGGEVQRLAIARVFLKDPPILILDEATSAVDTNTEVTIHDSLEELKRDRSTLVIAHRLSTIVGAQKILVIHEGRVVESGTHDELLSKEGRYHELWRKQVGRI